MINWPAEPLLGMAHSLADQLLSRRFNAIERAGARGRTDKELEEELNLKGSTQRPRRREIEQAGLIERNGQPREGAAVRVLTEEGKKSAGP